MPDMPDDIKKPASTPSVDDRSGRATTATPASCEAPIPDYAVLGPLDEKARLLALRTAYEAVYTSCTDDDLKDGFRQALITINNSLIDMDDGVPTTTAELMGTFLGDTRDKLSPTTRRSKPLGTVVTELEGYDDKIDVKETDSVDNFEENVTDDIADPDFTGIEYVPSSETGEVDADGITREFINFTEADSKDIYSEEHKSCLTALPCTFSNLKDPKIVTKEVDIPDTKFDVTIDDKDITSGCANGTGLFDQLMTAIDSSISMQFKNSRLDNKTFGQFYAATISSAMQQTTQFLIQKEQLKLDAAKIVLEYDRYHHDKDKRKYETALIKAQTAKALLEVDILKKQAPLELAKLTQDTKAAEKKVELTTRQIEEAKATVVGIYNQIGEGNATGKYQREKMKVDIEKIKKDILETTKNGVLDRNLTEAKVEQARVGVKTAKFDSILKKFQAYSTKVATEEAKASGASARRLTAADVQSKNKQASLYDQQRRMYVHGQRTDVLKIMKEMWQVQIDTLGAEGMAVEAIKGPEFSSKLERAGLDVGL